MNAYRYAEGDKLNIGRYRECGFAAPDRSTDYDSL